MLETIIKIIIGLAIIIIPIEIIRVQGYLILNNGIVIKRIIKDILVKREDIASVQRLPKPGLIICLFGINFGWVGFFGYYWSVKHGFLHLYLTKRKNLLLITLRNNRKILLSPNDDEIMEINNNIQS